MMSSDLLGFYLVRLRPRGPLLPARIWEACERDEDGNLMSDVLLCAEVAGRPWPVFDCYIRHHVWMNSDAATAETPGTSRLEDCPGCTLCNMSGAGYDAAMGLRLTTAVWPGNGYTLRRGVYPKCLNNRISEADFNALTELIENKNWLKEYPINREEQTDAVT